MLRTIPCCDFEKRSSDPLVKTTLSFSTDNLTSLGMANVSVPFGPLTVTTLSFKATCTPCGISTGFFPTRDINYQASTKTSPPIFCLRASLSLITPFEVLTTRTPKPLRKGCKFSTPQKTRRPGLLTLRNVEIVDLPSSIYFNCTTKTFFCFSPKISKPSINPSCWNPFKTDSFKVEYGRITCGWRTPIAFLILVNMSAIGSVSIILLGYQLAFTTPGSSPLRARSEE